MGKRDPRIDAIIDKSAPFARPIMKRLRAWVHRYCPGVQETLKWGHPSFTYRGKILCGMASFKAHATFGFWHPALRDEGKPDVAMGQLGRLTNVGDLPSEEQFAEQVKRAIALETSGVKVVRPKRQPKPEAQTPDDLQRALSQNPKAARTFAAFSPSCRRDYIEWLTEAKRPQTRDNRLLTTIEWLTEGKSRNWKYERC